MLLRTWLKRSLIFLVALLAVGALLIAVTPQGKTAFQTALFVTEVLAFPVQPQSWFTADTVREVVTYPQATGVGEADVYRIPDGRPRAAVLLFLGANAAGRDDKDVVTLGHALARSGFVTMFHWSPTMAQRHNIDQDEIENLVWAFSYLQSQDYVDSQRVGVGGFCVGASFALIAASDPRIKEGVAFINAFGPYYDARDLLLQVASRSRYYGDEVEPWVPDSLTLKVFTNELMESMGDPNDRDVLFRIFVNSQTVSEADKDGLSIEGAAAYQLLSGVGSLEEAERLYRNLPAEFRAAMDAVSPRFYVQELVAPVRILHDRGDQLVPAAESRRLSEHLKGFPSEVQYTELLTFDHVRPSRGGIKDMITGGYQLFHHMYGILRLAR